MALGINSLDSDTPIYIAGHRGLAGGAIWRKFQQNGFTNLIGVTSSELDLRDRSAVFDFVNQNSPEVVIDAAAKVGGIHANNSFPADFLSENLQIQVNLMDASNSAKVNRFLFLGSSCIYPKFATQPLKEESLLTGELEPTNDAYAVAKIAGIMQVQASRRQYGNHWISAMPTNLYGPGDNFHPENSHVLPGLIHKFHIAKIQNLQRVQIWGSGKPLREFLFVDDLADACLFLLNHYDSPETINIGFGSEISIRDLARLIAEVVGFEGQILQDESKPDGTPRKLLDTSKMNSLGWAPKVSLHEGVHKTYEWYLTNELSIRSK